MAKLGKAKASRERLIMELKFKIWERKRERQSAIEKRKEKKRKKESEKLQHSLFIYKVHKPFVSDFSHSTSKT